MLTRMAMKFGADGESRAGYDADVDFDDEHCCAEHEHDSQTDKTPESSDATEPRW